MTEPDSLPIQVQLARMEGTLDLIAERVAGVSERVTGLSSRVDQHGREIDALRSETQRLAEASVAAAQVAAAIKESEAARIAEAERAWSPFQKAIAVLVCVVGVVSLVIQVLNTH